MKPLTLRISMGIRNDIKKHLGDHLSSKYKITTIKDDSIEHSLDIYNFFKIKRGFKTIAVVEMFFINDRDKFYKPFNLILLTNKISQTELKNLEELFKFKFREVLEIHYHKKANFLNTLLTGTEYI